jgi:hypothetical protein
MYHVKTFLFVAFFNGNIGDIFAKTIVLVVYLGSSVLVTPIITSRFLLDLRLFLLGGYWGE